jgi:hypothetical protein
MANTYSPAFRKMTLTAHVSFSVGWLGTVAAFLALALIGLTSSSPIVVRSAFVATNVLGAFVIVPASIGSLVTGIAQSLITPWGVFRHYWVAAKLTLTVAATALLFVHQFTAVADAARRAVAAPYSVMPDVGPLATQLVVDAVLALVVLFANTALSVFKPWGRIPEDARARRKVVVGVLAALFIVFVVIHLVKGGHAH